MAKKRPDSEKGGAGIEGIFKGLAEVIERLGDLTEKGEQLSRSGRNSPWVARIKDLKGIFGFSVKMGLGGEGVKVEPFGNVSKDRSTGRSVVDEIREPLSTYSKKKTMSSSLPRCRG